MINKHTFNINNQKITIATPEQFEYDIILQTNKYHKNYNTLTSNTEHFNTLSNSEKDMFHNKLRLKLIKKFIFDTYKIEFAAELVNQLTDHNAVSNIKTPIIHQIPIELPPVLIQSISKHIIQPITIKNDDFYTILFNKEHRIEVLKEHLYNQYIKIIKTNQSPAITFTPGSSIKITPDNIEYPTIDYKHNQGVKNIEDMNANELLSIFLMYNDHVQIESKNPYKVYIKKVEALLNTTIDEFFIKNIHYSLMSQLLSNETFDNINDQYNKNFKSQIISNIL